MEKRFKIAFTAEENGQLLREAIAAFGISKRALTAIKFDGGTILVNGEERNVRHVLQIGDVVEIYFPIEKASDGLVPEYGTLKVVYEDAYLLVVEKPYNQSSIPSREHPGGTMANLVLGHLQQSEISSTVHIVTRLDKDTSGLMCIAKHRHIHHLMSEQQKRGQISRQYEAVVHGQVEDQSIIAPIGRTDTSIIEREIREDGQYAHTDVTCLRVYSNGEEEISHVRLKLHTGRTHQIRVHMSYIGHPLVGDDLYGGAIDVLARQALHCAQIDFVHPISQQQITLKSPLPADIAQLLK